MYNHVGSGFLSGRFLGLTGPGFFFKALFLLYQWALGTDVLASLSLFRDETGTEEQEETKTNKTLTESNKLCSKSPGKKKLLLRWQKRGTNRQRSGGDRESFNQTFFVSPVV